MLWYHQQFLNQRQFYLKLLNKFRRIEGDSSIQSIDPDVSKEIEKYLWNKLNSDCELNSMDAIVLCIMYGVNVIIWECIGAQNVSEAKISEFNYVEDKATWILMKEKDASKFLLRDA
jgi:hypothetical protein